MGKFRMGLLGQFETILVGEDPLPPEQYMEGIDRPTLLKIGTSLIRHNPNTSPFKDWKALLKMWFREGNEAFKNRIWAASEALSNEHGEPIHFLSPPAGIRFFEFAFNMPISDKKLTELETEVNLFKAYLNFISESTRMETVGDEYLDTIPAEHRPAYVLLHQQFPNSEFVNYHLYDIFNCQMIKAYMLFHFMESKPAAAGLLQAFYQHFGLTHWKEYFELLFPLLQAEIQRSNAAWTEVTVPRDEHFSKRCFFLDALTLDKLDEEFNADFKLMRGNPLYKISEGLYYIIFPLFVVEKIFKGLFFHFKVLYDAQPVKDIDSWNRFYTKDFAESQLLYDLFNYMYAKRSYIRYNGDEMDHALKKKGGIDYYMRQGNKLFLFESKSVFINAEIKQSGDLDKILVELKKKFWYDEKDGKQKPKALRQLARNVVRVLKMENPFDVNYKPQNVSIYPVIVVHDVLYNVPSLNYILSDWFRKELETLAAGLDVSRVKMLVVLNVDTLIMYADYLRLKKSTLQDLIDKYIETRKFNPNRKYEDPSHFNNAYAETLLSFSHFLDHYTKTGFKKVPNQLWEDSVRKFVPE